MPRWRTRTCAIRSASATGPTTRAAMPARTPMHWSDAAGGGFTEPGVRPWLPWATWRLQRGGPTREPDGAHPGPALIALRRRERDLRAGSYRTLGRHPRGCGPGAGGSALRRPQPDRTSRFPRGRCRRSVRICQRRRRSGEVVAARSGWPVGGGHRGPRGLRGPQPADVDERARGKGGPSATQICGCRPRVGVVADEARRPRAVAVEVHAVRRRSGACPASPSGSVARQKLFFFFF